MPHPSGRTAAATTLLLTLLLAADLRAIEEIVVEEGVADLLLHEAGDESEDVGKRQWALLPQLGYAPDTGPVLGAKFTHRNLLGKGITFDLDGIYAVINQRQSYAVSIGHPHLADDRFLVQLRVKWRFDPQREFFGLGNNDIGPDPASTHEFQDLNGTLLGGWRPWPRLALNVGVRLRTVDVRPGDREDECRNMRPCPFTEDAFPDLAGVDGGEVNPFFVSLVYNDRDDVVRPTLGWRGILKLEHTNRALLSDYEFTRLVADVGYLYPVFGERVVLGARFNGAWMDAPNDALPFWELGTLGGMDTLRGYFLDRFAGKGRVLFNTEVRALITEFDFFSLWHVKIDGALFGEGGRVFLSSNDAQKDFGLPEETADEIEDEVRFSYGGGIRFGLSEAIVARLDVAFSEEETALVYLVFGHPF
jgi:outer membrane protein assembly factor BamA